MNKDPWISVEDRVPPVGVVIETKVDRGNGVTNEQKLVFDNPLWFFPDHSMYVYYQPTHWRMPFTNNTKDNEQKGNG
jgi:hypothetical protein